MRYVWDPKKARANQKKHGVPFEEAVTVFVERDETVTRIISARLASKPERRRYEEGE